jgi:hypothetical protein
MAKSIDFLVPIPSSTPLGVPVQTPFGANEWREKGGVVGKETILTSLRAPVDKPEKIRLAYSEVANIYSGTGIEPSTYALSKKGFSLLAQLTAIARVTDSTDVNYQIDLPVSCHLVIKAPYNEVITSSLLWEAVDRLLSGLTILDGTNTVLNLDSLIRGSLVPPEL